MATNVIYQLSLKGWPIGSDGQINRDHSDIVTFTSLEEIETFIETNGSPGIYSVNILVVKE